MNFLRSFLFVTTTIFTCTLNCQNLDKPNIIYIYTDQLSETMMSCAGNKYLKTPAIDYIAKNGIRFTRAYTTNPVCSPARVSLMTGRLPGYFKDKEGNQVRDNKGSMKITHISQSVASNNIAVLLKSGGYDLVYGGKEHLPALLSPKNLGFQIISNDEREKLANKAANYIRGNHNNPYFMIVSLINPHDICYMAIRDFAETNEDYSILKNGSVELRSLDEALQLPLNFTNEKFFDEICPPLPPNFEPQDDEPMAIKSLIKRRSFRKSAREKYTPEQWRMHRWAYARLTEKVDSQIQIILDALIESGQEENTMVIFSSDHGDNDSSHKMEHKTVLYEESANIPFIVMWKGHINGGQLDTKSLISNGLDLLPTICDYSGVKGLSDPRGRSLRPLFNGNKNNWRKTLGIESEIGRMVVSEDGYKYVRYDFVGIEERLIDLNKDPFEKTHFTNDQSYTKILFRLRKEFDEQWFPESQSN